MKFYTTQTTRVFFFLFLFGSILNTGCNKKTNNGQDNLLTIDLSSPVVSKLIQITDLTDELQMSRLETRDNCLVSNFRGFVGKKHIICFERKNILHFSADGTFIREIMREGKGPGEYSNIRAWDVDNTERFLIMYDSNKDFIYRYDLDNGEFASPVHNVIPSSGNALQFLTDSLIAFQASVYSNFEHQYLIYSLNGNVSKGPKREAPNNNGFHFPGISSDFRKTKLNSIVYRPSTSDTIYQIKENGMSPLLIPIIGKNKQAGYVTEGEYTEHVYQSEDHLLFYKHSFKYETNAEMSHISVSINRGSLFLINLQNREVIEVTGIIAKYLEIGLPLWAINPCSDRRFYFSISAMDLIESIDRNLENENLSPEKLETIALLRKSISENDNPIIFSGTFKENLDFSHLR